MAGVKSAWCTWNFWDTKSGENNKKVYIFLAKDFNTRFARIANKNFEKLHKLKKVCTFLVFYLVNSKKSVTFAAETVKV